MKQQWRWPLLPSWSQYGHRERLTLVAAKFVLLSDNGSPRDDVGDWGAHEVKPELGQIFGAQRLARPSGFIG
jgi:hypothetical protein